ncbi:MAG: serine/threonine protein kinase [Planctomycetota bacterium]
MGRVVLGYLGPYRLLNVIHTGQFSQIWQAYDDGKRELVGVKTVLEAFRKDREKIALLRQEFKVGRKVLHPKILEMRSFAIDRGLPYIAMEWFAAPNLKSLVQQRGSELGYLLPEIIRQGAESLAYFNHQGWVHCDVKPDNLLVSKDAVVKLIDFSLARRSCPAWLRKYMPRSKKVRGTRSYMSPEQIRGEAVDTSTDVYGFACTAFELIAGRPPFTGTSSNDLLNKHLKSSPPALEAADNNVSPEFSRLIRRSMAKDPAIRPRSMEEFYRELQGIQVFKVTPAPPEKPYTADSDPGRTANAAGGAGAGQGSAGDD